MGAKLIRDHIAALENDAELIRVVTQRKDLGNIKFREKNFKLAHDLYYDALSSTENIKIMTPEVDKLKVVILQNMS